MAKDNIIFNKILDTKELTISYEIKGGELYFNEITKYIDPKESMFKDNVKLTYVLDKENTDKLFKLLKEKDLKKKFNSQNSFDEFRIYIDNNNLEHKFITEDI